jgi:hypothetical protein
MTPSFQSQANEIYLFSQGKLLSLTFSPDDPYLKAILYAIQKKDRILYIFLDEAIFTQNYMSPLMKAGFTIDREEKDSYLISF